MLRDISNSLDIQRRDSNEEIKSKGFKKYQNQSRPKDHHQGHQDHEKKDTSGSNCEGYRGPRKRDSPEVIRPKPSYRFPEFFRKAYEKMFPFVEKLHREGSMKERTMNLTSDVTFSRNSIKKFSQPFIPEYNSKIPQGQSLAGHSDPAEAIFERVKNSNKGLECNGSRLNVLTNGSTELIENSHQEYNISIGSKRSLEEEEETNSNGNSLLSTSNRSTSLPSMDTSSPSIKRLKSTYRTPIKKTAPRINITPASVMGHYNAHNCLPPYLNQSYERLDNSMTISAKAILKMVDDSLVSSDTSLYSQSLASISQINTSRGLRTGKKETININADDLQNVLIGDDDEDMNLCLSMPAKQL
ncbi:DEKNAAC100112 [Brettanomyces naardenensis]|uniref:DEKNAAC100112 n=1 Tax=Brettanomyces naardenensis TaxID=13370 RepID=A0A448YGQ5_BRENA|nr:DEKNAAC100112 [Brettanomyces naardenensis]